jgi:hypothetical protein
LPATAASPQRIAERLLGKPCDGSVEALGGGTTCTVLFACAGHLGSFNVRQGETEWTTQAGDADLGRLNSMTVWHEGNRQRVAVGGRTRVMVFELPGSDLPAP